MGVLLPGSSLQQRSPAQLAHELSASTLTSFRPSSLPLSLFMLPYMSSKASRADSLVGSPALAAVRTRATCGGGLLWSNQAGLWLAEMVSLSQYATYAASWLSFQVPDAGTLLPSPLAAMLTLRPYLPASWAAFLLQEPVTR